MVRIKHSCERCGCEYADKLYRVWSIDGVIKASSAREPGKKAFDMLICADCVPQMIEKTEYDYEDFQCPECGDWMTESFTGDDGEDYCWCCVLRHMEEEDNIEED